MIARQFLDVLMKAAPAASTMVSLYALVLLFWSPQWEAVYGIALAFETVAIIFKDWSENNSGFVVFISQSLPGFLVAILRSKILAGISIVAWLSLTALAQYLEMSRWRKIDSFDWIELAQI